MIFLRKFNEHSSYEEKLNGGGVDISLPNVSYCEDVKDVHYTPYNLVRFYVGEITPPQTVKIYTDSSTSIPIQVSEGNKWYSYLLPKDKGLFRIDGYSVKKVVAKADIVTESGETIIPPISTIEASFKGSNTSNVTDMNGMFGSCNKLTSLDVSSFDTSNVTNMNSMFYGCSGLTSLDVSSFDTSNVTDMNSMFDSCNKLTSLDVSSFNTSKVTNMSTMFNGCTSLTSLDLSNFNTSGVTSMGTMFYSCRALTSLNVSSFNTSNVTNMSAMFWDCSGLASLDLSGWDTSKVTNTNNMFRGCGNLKTITMIGCGQTTIDKIKAQLKEDNITGFTIVT